MCAEAEEDYDRALYFFYADSINSTSGYVPQNLWIIDQISYMTPDMTYTFDAIMYSDISGENGQNGITWSVTNGTGSATIDPSTGVLTAQSTGTVTVRATCGRLNKSTIRTINVTKLLIYQTESTYYYDESGIYAEDLTYADMSTDELRALDWLNWTDFVGYTPASHRSSWENMVVTLFSTGSLQTVALDMINHFMIGSGSNYTNAALTAAIKTHSSTQAYISAVENKIKQLMNEFDGDIASLLYEVETRNQNPLIIEMKADNIMQPVYNTSSDRTNGLTICVDSLWGNKIEVTSYVVSESTYTCTLHYTLYDHFGLDQNDVENYGYLNGFRSWYILQHYADYNGNYKPFVTLMEFDVTFSGTIS